MHTTVTWTLFLKKDLIAIFEFSLKYMYDSVVSRGPSVFKNAVEENIKKKPTKYSLVLLNAEEFESELTILPGGWRYEN